MIWCWQRSCKHQNYPYEKLHKYKYFTGEEILPSNQCTVIEKAKFTNYTLGKDLEKQTKKQVDALKSLNLPNKIDELKQIGSIFLESQII